MFVNHFSISSILFLIVVTTVLILFFSFLKSYLPIFFKGAINSHKFKNKFKKWIYISELLVIVLVLITFVSYSLSRNLLVASVLLLVLLLLVFFLTQYFFKDYLVGLLIKSSGELRIGDQISIDNTQGRISALRKTQIQLKNSEGNTIYIPYSYLSNKTKMVQQVSDKVNGFTFEIDLPKVENYDKDIESLIQFTERLPWIHSAYKAVVDLKEETQTSYQLTLTVFSFDKKYHRKIESTVKEFTVRN